MFAKVSKYLEHELEVARKDVSAWAARPLSFESEGKANLGAFLLPAFAGLGNAPSFRPAPSRSLHAHIPPPFPPLPCCLA